MSTNEKKSFRRRKLLNYFRTAKLSKRNHVYVFFGSLVLFGLVDLYGVRLLRKIGAQILMINDAPADQLMPIYEMLGHVALLFFAMFALYALASTFFLITIEQKVGGATVAVLAYIEQMRLGNFDYERQLREGDELKSIMEALHGLAADIKKAKNQK